MRIAYVINSVEGGGAAAPVPSICALLRAQGAQIVVFALTGRDRRGLPAMLAAGLDVRIRPDPERGHRHALAWLMEEMVNWRPQVIWTSLTRATLLAQIAAERLGVPVVSWQHNAYLKPINRALLRLRRNRTALWIADSDCVATLTRKRLGVDPRCVVTWPLFAVDPLAPRATPWRPGETLRVGTLGRLHRNKGYDVLLHALGRLRASGFRPPVPFVLEIAGEGSQRKGLEHLIRRYGLENVHLTGFTAQPTEFLAGLHLYLQPSRTEGMGIAAHEAMQAGLPIIASAVGEMPYSIRHRQTGLIVEPGSVEALAYAMAEYLGTPEQLQTIGAEALRAVTGKFSQPKFVSAGREVFARVRAVLS